MLSLAAIPRNDWKGQQLPQAAFCYQLAAPGNAQLVNTSELGPTRHYIAGDDTSQRPPSERGLLT
jgi:hypothetical protein